MANMATLSGHRGATPWATPLEGCAAFRAQERESGLEQLGRSEWWLWLCTFLVTTLSALAFLLSAIPSFFQHSEHFYEIRSDQARWGILCLLLLFNGWVLRRQWTFRRQRKQLSEPGATAQPGEFSLLSATDPITGLHTKPFLEQQLVKEIARAKRQNSTLSLATVHIEDIAELTARCGPSATELALTELARRLKRACRGSDFAVRLGSADFLLVLPECGLGEVKLVLNRLGSLEMTCAGRKLSLAYTTGWVDYQAGDLPADLLKRAAEILPCTRTPLEKATPRPARLTKEARLALLGSRFAFMDGSKFDHAVIAKARPTVRHRSR